MSLPRRQVVTLAAKLLILYINFVHDVIFISQNQNKMLSHDDPSLSSFSFFSSSSVNNK